MFALARDLFWLVSPLWHINLSLKLTVTITGKIKPVSTQRVLTAELNRRSSKNSGLADMGGYAGEQGDMASPFYGGSDKALMLRTSAGPAPGVYLSPVRYESA